jgi:hypothetical protein
VRSSERTPNVGYAGAPQALARHGMKASLLAALRQSGIGAPARCLTIARDVITTLALDLSGLTVLTEAGSGLYALTPALAALGGAERVIAVTRDSRHGRADDNARAASMFADLCGIHERLSVVTELSPSVISSADIVTNLGFVRPIDADFVASMKPDAAIALMCESWEVRSADVDLAACQRRGILAMGTNEDHPAARVFDYCGILGIRLLLDAGFEVLGTRVLVVGRDRFAPVVAEALTRAGAVVDTVRSLDRPAIVNRLADAEVLLLADYGDDVMIVAENGVLTPADLAPHAATLTLVQFAGGIDAPALRSAGIVVSPADTAPPRRMAQTLATLGPRPVLTLHAAGLKVGELCARASRAGMDAGAAMRHVLSRSTLAQAPATNHA